MLRPILVFWLLKFWIPVCKVSLLITVEIRDLTHVLLVPSPLASDLSRADSGSRSIGIPEFLGISLVFMLLLFLVFHSLIGRLGILSENKRRALSPGFVPAIIFHSFLGLDLVDSGMGRSLPLKTILVSLPHVKTRLWACLGLSSYNFYY